MKTITLDDKTYDFWLAEAEAEGLTVEQLLARKAQRIADIKTSQQQFAEGKCTDAREAMRQIAKEKGIRFDR